MNETSLFTDLPKPRRFLRSPEDRVRAAERTFKKVKAAEAAGQLGCTSRSLIVKGKKTEYEFPVAAWQAEAYPALRFELTDCRETDGAFILVNTAVEDEEPIATEAIIFGGIDLIKGVTRVPRVELKRDVGDGLVIMKNLVTVHYNHRMATSPKPEDIVALSAALELVPRK